MTQRSIRLASAILAASALTMCASIEDVSDIQSGLQSSRGDKENSRRVSDELSALGISTDTANDEDWNALLTIDQVIGSEESSQQEYAFQEIDGVHPCQREDVITDDCREISEGLARDLERNARSGSQSSAVSEIQAITPDIVDPQSFDPVITAGELGRQPIPQSQAAQALGFQLLQPPALPVEPEADDPADDVTTVLPDIPLDIIINQGPGTGSQ